ncbi:phosphate acetyltransferase [Cecembia lonarensis]|uniref:Phosphate acetyltransferase n=1 Tax=Cecembia lonarensis (strain CCUG 58316 / KCTC 22772 / LW9) TaxID=1225176 RepID=K1L0F1_CECL9|nr:phosphate acetyltransferase [Cecembia lonarensis]EKB49845.1 Phosphate acetyltransferase [Cecembia lonarensis LW9]
MMEINKSVFIATAEPYSGKSTVALGIVDMLLSKTQKIGYFKPIINHSPEAKSDVQIDTLIQHFKLPIAYNRSYAYTRDEANLLAESGMQGEIIDTIISKYKKLEEEYDFTIIEGSDFLGEGTAFEFDANATIAKNLGTPVIIVTSGADKTAQQISNASIVTIKNFLQRKVKVLGVVVNKVEPANLEEVKNHLQAQLKKDILVTVIPNVTELKSPSMKEVKDHLQAEVMFGEQYLSNRADHFIFGAMQIANFLNHIKQNVLIVTPGDRADIIMASLQANLSKNYPKIAGIVLTGGFEIAGSVIKLMEGSNISVPILRLEEPSFYAATKVAGIHSKISPDNPDKIHLAISTFRKYMDIEALEKEIAAFKPVGMTPRMFQYQLVSWAKAKKKHIVLPEGKDERVLKAADRLVRQDIVKITLLGDVNEISSNISRLGLCLNQENCQIINPQDAFHYDEYVNTLFELRKGKNMPLQVAKDLMTDVAYFGTMMVYKGHADGMVSGAIHTTAHTIRPALQFVKTKPGISLVSSIFFMCLPDRVTIFGDCAININPTAEELAEIAISSADTSIKFGIDARVAMLSYSSGASGTGEDVEKVRKATEIVKSKRPDIQVEGPIQYDAAVDPITGKQKMPDSKVAGNASVLIFPDLNTGNNTYKAVQRETGAIAIGPMLQGLNKPVNDLSRGCTVDDIFNTVVITAIQAQED